MTENKFKKGCNQISDRQRNIQKALKANIKFWHDKQLKFLALSIILIFQVEEESLEIIVCHQQHIQKTTLEVLEIGKSAVPSTARIER